jgi:hypothetical protein
LLKGHAPSIILSVISDAIVHPGGWLAPECDPDPATRNLSLLSSGFCGSLVWFRLLVSDINML